MPNLTVIAPPAANPLLFRHSLATHMLRRRMNPPTATGANSNMSPSMPARGRMRTSALAILTIIPAFAVPPVDGVELARCYGTKVRRPV